MNLWGFEVSELSILVGMFVTLGGFLGWQWKSGRADAKKKEEEAKVTSEEIETQRLTNLKTQTELVEMVRSLAQSLKENSQVTEEVHHEVTHNHGSSMKDAVVAMRGQITEMQENQQTLAAQFTQIIAQSDQQGAQLNTMQEQINSLSGHVSEMERGVRHELGQIRESIRSESDSRQTLHQSAVSEHDEFRKDIRELQDVIKLSK